MVLAFKGTKIAPVKNGANRWINIGGIEFQPSEIAKFALILMFAHFIALYGSKMKTFRFGFLPFMGILVVIAGLVFLESHVSATLIICLIAVLMMFIRRHEDAVLCCYRRDRRRCAGLRSPVFR